MSGERAFCPSCKSETAVRVKPVFSGFEKVGEERSCTFCGHAVVAQAPSEQSHGQRSKAPSAADLFGQPYEPPRSVNPFGDGPITPAKAANPFGGPVEIARAKNPFGESAGPVQICRHCVHYVVNPFTQKCMLHHRDVSATDTCPDFEAKHS